MPKKQDAKQQAALRMLYELGREASLIHRGEGSVGGALVGLGHLDRFAAAWVRVRAAFGDG